MRPGSDWMAQLNLHESRFTNPPEYSTSPPPAFPPWPLYELAEFTRLELSCDPVWLLLIPFLMATGCARPELALPPMPAFSEQSHQSKSVMSGCMPTRVDVNYVGVSRQESQHAMIAGAFYWTSLSHTSCARVCVVWICSTDVGENWAVAPNWRRKSR